VAYLHVTNPKIPAFCGKVPKLLLGYGCQVPNFDKEDVETTLEVMGMSIDVLSSSRVQRQRRLCGYVLLTFCYTTWTAMIS
jgi:hypothetical protein